MIDRWLKIAGGGYAGRTGFIRPASKEQNAKYVFTTYDLTETLHADLVGELKRLADAKE